MKLYERARKKALKSHSEFTIRLELFFWKHGSLTKLRNLTFEKVEEILFKEFPIKNHAD